MNKVELLAPAGNMEKLQYALAFGADAVYLGGKAFGLRAMGGNFTVDEIRAATEYAHKLNKKVYVTVNSFPHEGETNLLDKYLADLNEIGVDALLVADLGVFSKALEFAPNIPKHISTQANTVNSASVQMWQKLGAARVVLARELSRKEIIDLSKKVDIELEAFVHGAMCIAYSGRCLLSSYMTGRDANRGACTGACRWKYSLVEETRPDEEFPIMEDESGTYIMNSKDLCLLPYLPDLIENGIVSLKIEGRMKSVHYVSSVVKAYRMAIDSYYNDKENYSVKKEWLDELEKVSHRPYTTGFFLNKPEADAQVYSSSSYEQTSDFIGVVKEYNPQTKIALVEQRNHFTKGEEIELFSPNLPIFRQTVEEITDLDNNPIEKAANAKMQLLMKMASDVEPFTILRRDCK